MRIGQQVLVASDRGPLKGNIGTVEEVYEEWGRQWYGVRVAYPYDSVLHYFKVHEIHRTH